jgi:hypothetical protein
LRKSSEHDSQKISTSLKEKDTQLASLGHKVDELRSELDSYANLFAAAKKVLARYADQLTGERPKLDGDTLSAMSLLYYEHQRDPKNVL